MKNFLCRSSSKLLIWVTTTSSLVLLSYLILANVVLTTNVSAENLKISETALTKDGPLAKLLEESTNTYRQIKSDSDPTAFGIAENKAKCILIFPRVTTIALVAGGSHGDGVASCRSGVGIWSGPLFLNLNGGSVGLQIGGEASKSVIFLTADESQKQLLDGRLTFSPTTTFIAGERTKQITDYDEKKQVLIFTTQSGFFGGVALSGMYVAASDKEQKAFYNEPVTLKTVVTNYSFDNPPGELRTWIEIFPHTK